MFMSGIGDLLRKCVKILPVRHFRMSLNPVYSLGRGPGGQEKPDFQSLLVCILLPVTDFVISNKLTPFGDCHHWLWDSQNDFTLFVGLKTYTVFLD